MESSGPSRDTAWAMSEENVELVRSALDAYNAGPDAFLECMAEDIEVRPDASVFPEAKPFRGREKFRRFLAEIDEGGEGGRQVKASSGRCLPSATGSWLEPTGEVGAGPAASTSAPI